MRMEIWKWHKRVINLFAKRGVCLFAFFFVLFQTIFWLKGQASAPIPHKSRTLSHSPNRLKSHPIFSLRTPDPRGLYQHVSYEPENLSELGDRSANY